MQRMSYGLAVVLGDGEARELDGLEVVLAARWRVPDVAHHPHGPLAVRLGHRCRGPVTVTGCAAAGGR